MDFEFLAYAFLNAAIVAGISPLLTGVIRKVKAYSQGRRGASVIQPYYNLAKLMKKQVVYSKSSSWIMRATPYLNMGLILACSVLVPIGFLPSNSPGFVEIIALIYLFALAKFFMALSGLDSASTFGGMGSSREMSLSSIIEPVLIVVLATLAFVLKTTNTFDMFLAAKGLFLTPPLVLVAIPLFIVVLTETSRIPVDNPETHLELTMVHETMILEQSGRNLALMEYSHAIKQTLLTALFLNVVFPVGVSKGLSVASVLFSTAIFLAASVLFSIVVGIAESSVAKLRLFRLPNLFMVAYFVSLLTILLVVFS